jgi:hypothetical protein
MRRVEDSEPQRLKIVASTAASLIAGSLEAVSRVKPRSAARLRKCRRASARSARSSSEPYRCANSSNFAGSWLYHLRSSVDGATSLHHSSSAALTLVIPRGHSRSTRTRRPSSSSGSSYTRRTRTFVIAVCLEPLPTAFRVSGLVALEDVSRDASTVADLNAMGFGPLPDGFGINLAG